MLVPVWERAAFWLQTGMLWLETNCLLWYYKIRYFSCVQTLSHLRRLPVLAPRTLLSSFSFQLAWIEIFRQRMSKLVPTPYINKP